MQGRQTPLIRDWSFWAAVLALIAIVLSQSPPIKLWFLAKRLDVDVHSKIGINHTFGNPNVGILIGIRNTGGRELRVASILINVARDGKSITTLPATGFYENSTSTTPILFVPFDIKPGENWVHSLNFVPDLLRLDDRLVRESTAVLASDIRQKLSARRVGDMQPVTADEKSVQPFLALDERLFIWKPGEYEIELSVNAEPDSASFNKRYRFTIFESDTAQLQARRLEYKLGGGITFPIESQKPINIPLIYVPK